MQTFYLILINLIVVFVGLFIHGDPPKHYYLVIYPIPILLISNYLAKLNNKILFTMLTLYSVFIISYLVYSGWYQTDNPYLYKNVKNLTDQISKDANGRVFGLKRIGEFDYFENNFSNNYIYLLELNGAKIDGDTKLKYTIYEDKNTYTKEE